MTHSDTKKTATFKSCSLFCDVPLIVTYREGYRPTYLRLNYDLYCIIDLLIELLYLEFSNLMKKLNILLTMKTIEVHESYVTPTLKELSVNSSMIICGSIEDGTEPGAGGEGSGSDVDFGGGI